MVCCNDNTRRNIRLAVLAINTANGFDGIVSDFEKQIPGTGVCLKAFRDAALDFLLLQIDPVKSKNMPFELITGLAHNKLLNILAAATL